MYFVRTPCEWGMDAISATLTFLWEVVGYVEGLFFKDLKQTMKKEQCEVKLLVTASMPGNPLLLFFLKSINNFSKDQASLSFMRKFSGFWPWCWVLQRIFVQYHPKKYNRPFKSQQLPDKKGRHQNWDPRESVLEGLPRLKIYLSLSQRASWTESLLEWMCGTARRIILFAWHGPHFFVNSVRDGFVKKWEREKQEEGELQKNRECDVNSSYSSFSLWYFVFLEDKNFAKPLSSCSD